MKYKVRLISPLSKESAEKFIDFLKEEKIFSTEQIINQKILQTLDIKVQEMLREICQEKSIYIFEVERVLQQGGVERYFHDDELLLSVYPAEISFDGYSVKAEAKYFKH